MHITKSILRLFLLSTLIVSSVAWAEVKLNGYFIANDNECPAYKSFRKKTNPGNVRLVEDRAYPVLSKNKFDATHYRLKIKEATPRERWVALDCGTFLTQCDENEGSDESDNEDVSQPSRPNSPSLPGQGGKEYLLALSWQPAFCQSHQSKAECQSQTGERYDATHLTLHGLWPQPKNNTYCNIPNSQKKLDQRSAWSQLPSLRLSDDLMSELIEIMPGVSSHLQRHEWTKHGSCYSETPDEYFKESMKLALDINNSSVRDLFANNIGERVTSRDIKSRFDSIFGQGAGNKVMVKCSGNMISELWINLKGDIEEGSNIGELLANAPDASVSCQGGVIDAVGF